jgi:benzylsuccinate CoA-transferase BbsF subunit
MNSTQGALSDVRVLDFTWAGAGPFATKFLADFGAQVIKLESRKRLDMSRTAGPFAHGKPDPNATFIFLTSNTSKMGITLNLSHTKGIEIAKKLAALSDVVIENFSPGTMEKLGLDYKSLAQIKPDLIMASSSICGQTGPMKRFAGWANSGSCLGGHHMLTGWPDREPVYPNTAYPDVVQPVFTAISILAALDYKKRTGKGQHIDIAQVETMIQCISPAMLEYFQTSRTPTRMGNRSLYACPHGIFPCKGNDKWCAIAVFNDDQWRSFCTTMGKPELIVDERFIDIAMRKKHEDELESLISSWTVQFEREELAALLEKARVPSGPVQDASDILDRDPHIRERGSFVRLTHPVVGECNHPTQPAKLSRSPAQVSTGPLLGEHNEYVYKTLLGLNEDEYATLSESGVFE